MSGWGLDKKGEGERGEGRERREEGRERREKREKIKEGRELREKREKIKEGIDGKVSLTCHVGVTESLTVILILFDYFNSLRYNMS